MTDPAPAIEAGRPRLGYQPALDGIRGVSVLAVLAFHGGFGWASGGYLGVSVFFTLSGFLITRVLVEERAATGAIRLGRFYARRVRRLLPAGVLTLCAVLLLTRWGEFEGVRDLRRDLVGAGLQVANWFQLTSGRSYADLFDAGASPVEHYWSLAIEEQFYLLWPLVLLLLAHRSDRLRRAVVPALFVVFAAAAPVIAAVWGSEAAYLATPARVAEILAGAALAVLVEPARLGRAWRWIGPAAAAVIVVVTALTPAAGGWAYHGGLPLFAVLSALVVAGALVPGPLRSGLSARPLVALGTISYGVYLAHWPIFLLLDAHPRGLGTVPLFLVKCAVTVVAATVSYLVVERPIRSLHHHRATVPIGAAAVAAVTVLALVAGPTPAPGFGEIAGSKLNAVRIPPGDPGPILNARGGQRRPARILVVGDSTGEVLQRGLVEWAFANPTLAQVEPASLAGCGFVRGGRITRFDYPDRQRCDDLVHRELVERYRALRPDVVVISVSGADTWDRTWDGGDGLRPTDEPFARHLREDYAAFFDAAVAAGVPKVVWLRPPILGISPEYYDPSFLDGSQDLIQEQVEAAVERHPGVVSILDYRSWFEANGWDRDTPSRPDGVHLIPEAAVEVAETYLGPALLDLALER